MSSPSSSSWAHQSPLFLDPSQPNSSPHSAHSDSESPSSRLSPSSAIAVLSPPRHAATLLPSEEKRMKIMAECSTSLPVVQDAILHILNSFEWECQGEVQGDLLIPIIEAVHFPNGGRSGSRGGIDRYRCRYGACTKVIKRRDHMLNHVRCHLGLKPWVCSFTSVDTNKAWFVYFATFSTVSTHTTLLSGTRFLRGDDLKRHLRHIHKHDMDENGYAPFFSLSSCPVDIVLCASMYFPVPNRVKQVRGPRKGRRADPYPTQDVDDDDEYKPYGTGYVARRGRTGLWQKVRASWLSCELVSVFRRHSRLCTPHLFCFRSEFGD
jgi:hypothetical protein